MDILYKRINSLITDGVTICGRKYRFLAFSSSQLREHSCWMFHQRADSNISCETIREWMGDFRNIHPVAKMAARVSVQLQFDRVYLCFSF
jgi:RNA-dependent RNA polymerase